MPNPLGTGFPKAMGITRGEQDPHRMLAAFNLACHHAALLWIGFMANLRSTVTHNTMFLCKTANAGTIRAKPDASKYGTGHHRLTTHLSPVNMLATVVKLLIPRRSYAPTFKRLPAPSPLMQVDTSA